LSVGAEVVAPPRRDRRQSRNLTPWGGDRCRVDAIDEVVEGLLDSAEDGDDELARRTIDDVESVRDAVAQEDEVAGHSRRCLLTAMMWYWPSRM